MALKDLLALTDDKLQSKFESKPHDVTKDRARIVKGIDSTLEKFKAKATKGKKWFVEKNGVVKFTGPFQIDGKDSALVPSERFEEFLGKLKVLVNEGEFDIALAVGNAMGTLSAPKATGKKRAGWSPERRERQAAAIAARQATKAAPAKPAPKAAPKAK